MLVPFSYFPFFKRPNMSNLQPADIAYLDSQRCLHVPAGKFSETLISHYFLYVHPCLPIINEGEFWTKFRKREDGSPTFSLLVFQAMLFAASSVRLLISTRCHFSSTPANIPFPQVYPATKSEAKRGSVDSSCQRWILPPCKGETTNGLVKHAITLK